LDLAASKGYQTDKFAHFAALANILVATVTLTMASKKLATAAKIISTCYIN